MQFACLDGRRAPRLGLGAAVAAATLALAPGSALGAGSAPTTTTVESVSPVQRSMQPVTITATVQSTGAPLTGTVQLRNQFAVTSSIWDGRFALLANARCPGTSSTCTVSVTAPTLLPTPDVNRIVAHYAGDDVNAMSSSDPVPVEVEWATTTPTARSTAPRTVYGQPVQIETGLALDPPSSWVDGSWYGRTWVHATDTASGQRASSLENPATLALEDLAVGTHRIAVEWQDASIHPWPWKLPAAPLFVDHVVEKASTTLGLSTDVTGSDVRLTAHLATVAPGSGMGTGEVTFSDGDEVVGRAVVGADGTATTTVRLAPGAHTIRAAYAGDASFKASTAAERRVVVGGGDEPDGPAAPAAGRLIVAHARPSGVIVTRVRCVRGRVTVTARRKGKVYGRRSARCVGRQRIVLPPRAGVARSGKVRVAAAFSAGGKDKAKVRLGKRAKRD